VKTFVEIGRELNLLPSHEETQVESGAVRAAEEARRRYRGDQAEMNGGGTMLLAVEIIIGLAICGIGALLLLGMCKCAAMEPPESIWERGQPPYLLSGCSLSNPSGNAHDRRLARRQQARAARIGQA